MFETLKKLFKAKPPVDFRELRKRGALIIDVRTPDEFGTGHLREAKNIPLNTIGQHVEKIRKTNKPVITVCRSGSRSSMAVNMLKRAGIEAYNGGAWNILEKKLY